MADQLTGQSHWKNANQHPNTDQDRPQVNWNQRPTLVIREVRHFPHERTANGQITRTPSGPGPELQGDEVVEIACLDFLPQN